ncbi:reverse transcriptase domain-containing protein [Tanacetum coccineum]|uniref:Reverse transcriptase domain-containing protein n=1 Tax=Tanacetum coccineum TaxID=301880 RepID=A0ABQ4Y3H2_9ASTR
MDELNEGTIDTWDELQTAFISRFFPPALFDRLLGEIRAFSQQKKESLTDAWLRMKEMLRNCHGHYLSKGNIIKIFYHDLNETTQEVLNVIAGGTFLYKTPNQAYQLLEDKDLLKLEWAKNQKTKPSLKKTISFAYEDTFMDLKIKLETTTKNQQASIQTLEAKFNRFANKQSGRPSGSLSSNTQTNPKGTSSKPYQPPHDRNDIDEEDDEPTPQPKPKEPKPVKETPIPKPYKLTIPYPQRPRKEKMEAQYGKFLDMIRAVRINVPLVDVLAGMPNYGKFLKELVIPPKLGDPRSFLIPCNFNKAFSCNALADLGASINLIPYSLYAKLSLETPKPTKMSVRLADRSFQYPVGIDENMLVEVGKFTFPTDFVILKIEEDIGTERMIFHIDSVMKHSYSNDDTCLSIDVIDKILEEDFDSLLDEGSKILHSIEGTILEEKLFAEFDEFMAMNTDENSESESDTEEPPFEKITFNTDYKIKKSLEELPTDLELKPIPDNLEYVFLEELSFLLKGGITVVTNEKDELVPTRTVTGWRVCIDYRKLNEAIAKDHFPFPFMDQMRMPFGLCNAPATFQKCMLVIYHDMIEESIEVFMDDFSVFGNSFDNFMNNLDKMLQRCKDAHLVLNWEKCHFMVKEGIVLGHKVSEAGLEVNKAKINVISKLPPPLISKVLDVF